MAAAINTYQTAVIYRVTVKATGKVVYAMPSSAADGSCYTIEKIDGKLVCSCPDCQYRQRDCKHILALADHLTAKAALKAASAPAPKVQPTRDNALPARYSEPETVSLVPGTPSYMWASEGHNGDYIPRDYYQHAYR